MKRRTMALLASTVFLPTFAVAQTQPAQRPATPQPTQAQAGQAGTPTAADFVSRANSGNLFEIQSSQLALEKSQITVCASSRRRWSRITRRPVTS